MDRDDLDALHYELEFIETECTCVDWESADVCPRCEIWLKIDEMYEDHARKPRAEDNYYVLHDTDEERFQVEIPF